METREAFKFTWDLIGDIELGRPNLGPDVPVGVYRIMEYSFREVIEELLGIDAGEKLIFEAGKRAGRMFFSKILPEAKDFPDFISNIQNYLKEYKIGIFRVEESDPKHENLVIAVSEDLDCSGLPEIGYGVCTFDEGFISGILEEYTGRRCQVKEIDCWCTGERTCRFTVKILPVIIDGR
jgi:uncharacterized protein